MRLDGSADRIRARIVAHGVDFGGELLIAGEDDLLAVLVSGVAAFLQLFERVRGNLLRCEEVELLILHAGVELIALEIYHEALSRLENLRAHRNDGRSC